MKRSETRAETKRSPTAKELGEQLEATRYRVRLLAAKRRGYAAHQELAGADAGDAGVCALHNCAMDVDGILSERAVRP